MRNTEAAHGVVVFAGADTKLMQNTGSGGGGETPSLAGNPITNNKPLFSLSPSPSPPPPGKVRFKRTSLDLMLNKFILGVGSSFLSGPTTTSAATSPHSIFINTTRFFCCWLCCASSAPSSARTGSAPPAMCVGCSVTLLCCLSQTHHTVLPLFLNPPPPSPQDFLIYLPRPDVENPDAIGALTFFSFVIILQTLVPISLYIRCVLVNTKTGFADTNPSI